MGQICIMAKAIGCDLGSRITDSHTQIAFANVTNVTSVTSVTPLKAREVIA